MKYVVLTLHFAQFATNYVPKTLVNHVCVIQLNAI